MSINKLLLFSLNIVLEFKHIPSADVYKDTNSAPVSDDEDVSTTPDAPYTSAGTHKGILFHY